MVCFSQDRADMRNRRWLRRRSLAFVSGNMAIVVLTWQEDRFVVSASLYGHTTNVKCLSFRPGCVRSRSAAGKRPRATHPLPRPAGTLTSSRRAAPTASSSGTPTQGRRSTKSSTQRAVPAPGGETTARPRDRAARPDPPPLTLPAAQPGHHRPSRARIRRRGADLDARGGDTGDRIQGAIRCSDRQLAAPYPSLSPP